MKTFALKNGDQIPVIGLGTWKMVDGTAVAAAKTAIQGGFRHIDCARIYGNEPDVGFALNESFGESELSRDDIWVTSKLWNDCHRAEHVRPAMEQTLADLQLEYLDLYLMHWPVVLKHGIELPESGDDFLSLEEVPLLETWGAMQQCLESGLCRHIGVSNFSQDKLQRLIDGGGVSPAVNQVESHPLLQQQDLLDFCNRNEILFTAYSPLGSADRPDRLRKDGDPVLLDNAEIRRIAEQHQITPAQVLLSWAIGRGTIAIPKSTDPERLKQNLAAINIELTAEDMASIRRLDQHYRIIDGSFWGMPGSPYSTDSLWDESVSKS